MTLSTEKFTSHSCWIWGEPEPAQQNVWRYFRHHWTAPADIRRVTLLITADSLYEFSLNRTPLGRGPVRSFPFAYSYDVYDVTALVHPGADNVIAALVNFLGDHTMSYIRGAAGFRCEIVVRDSSGNFVRIGTNAEWCTAPCEAFNTLAPRISVQLGFEEQFDARREIVDWDSPELNDSHWAQAVEVDATPWQNLTPRTIPFLTEDLTSPVAVKAVELARIRPGCFWNLDLRDMLRTVRTGLRSAPPGERGSIFFTEVIAPRDCTVSIYTFPNYEPIPIRVNQEVYSDSRDPLGTDEWFKVSFKQGTNLVMLCNVEWPSLLFATSENLTFTANRFVSGAAWALITPLNELNGELDALWKASSFDELPANARIIGIPESANKTDIFALTSSQQFFAVPGGFCTYDITRATPRPSVNGAGRPLPSRPTECLAA